MLKFFGLVTLLSWSAAALSQTCYVDMVDRYQRTIRSYTSYDANEGCKEGMKQCRLAIRTEPQLGGVDCLRDRHTTPTPQPQPYPQPYPQPQPQPQPQPNPYPYPQPYPQPDQQYPHYVSIGEQIYNVSNNRFAEVIAIDNQGKYVLRYRDNGAVGTGWTREDIAPLRGCDVDLCVNDRIYNTSTNRFAVIVGLQMTGKFVLKFDDNGAVGDGWTREDVAVLEGCDMELCVGEPVWNTSNNRYARIAGLQLGQKYVLTFDDNGATGDGWTRDDVAVMKGCQVGVCVGQRVINLSNRRFARVVALQTGGRFVLKFEDNGATGDGWTVNDIAPTR